jgi:hypothetical protein
MSDLQRAVLAAFRPLRRPTLYLAALSFVGGVGLLSNGSRSKTLPITDVSNEVPAGAAAGNSTFSTNRPPPDKRETCWCHRQHASLLGDPGLRNTTCSLASFARGPGQKVIGFTYYEAAEGRSSMEAEREYFRGITENLQLIR